MHIVFLGKPLSGKGTQAKLLAKHLKIKHISPGKLLRKEIKQKTKLAKIAQKHIQNGTLVPTKTILTLLKRNLPKGRSYILDGFPRNLAQARAFEKINAIDIVFEITCTNKTAYKRVAKRESEHRVDDKKEIIKKRMLDYKEETIPVLKYFKESKKVVKINGEKRIPTQFKEILKGIEKIK
jgi:adenylate kinase